MLRRIRAKLGSLRSRLAIALFAKEAAFSSNYDAPLFSVILIFVAFFSLEVYKFSPQLI